MMHLLWARSHDDPFPLPPPPPLKMSEESGQQRVTVAVRIRPKKNSGQERYDSTCVAVEPPSGDGGATAVSIGDPQGKADPLVFTVDKAFDDADDQEAIYQDLVKDAVVRCMGGEGDAVFVAYGQTGSGKTYTMLGEGSQPKAKSSMLDCEATVSSLMSPHTGVLMRIVQDILHRKYSLESLGDWHCVVVMAAVEVYNETFNDLLAEGDGRKSGGPLEVREFEDNLLLQGLSRINILSAAQAQKVFQAALRNRSVAFTNMNDASSRSHAIFSTELFVQRRTGMNPNPPDVSALVEHVSTRRQADAITNPSNDFKMFPYEASKVTLVDLAGSERIKKSGVAGKELTEAVAVNKSLSALGKVVHQLCLGAKHIPFRESKLTKYMQASFSNPRSTITFITNVSPASSNYSESVNSLRFASRLKELKVASSPQSLSATSAFEEDGLLKRTQVLEELAADLRVAQAAGYKGFQARLQGRLYDANRLKSTMGAYLRRTQDIDAHLVRAEVERILSHHRSVEAEQRLVHHDSPDDLVEVAPDTARNRSTSNGVIFKQKADSQHTFLRTELELLDEDGFKLKEALDEVVRMLEDAQEQSQLGNKLLASKADLQRAIQAADAEHKHIEEQLDTLVNPHTSDNALLKAELGQDLRSKAADDLRHAANKGLAEKLIALNKAKIDVLSIRVASMVLRDEIEVLRGQAMVLHSGLDHSTPMIDPATVANSAILDMSKVVQLCKTRPSVQGYASGAPLVDGMEVLFKLMDERLQASDPQCSQPNLSITQKSKAPRASPVAFYFSPATATTLSRQLMQNSKLQSQAQPTTTTTDHKNIVDAASLFETHIQRNVNAVARLTEACRVWSLHGRLLEWLDALHLSKRLTSVGVRELYAILDEVPLQYGSIEHVVQRAQRRAEGTLSGSDGDDSGSGTDSEVGDDFGVVAADPGIHRNVFDGPTAKKDTTRSPFAKEIVARLADNAAAMRNGCILRCLQAHSLLGLHDKYSAAWYALDPVFDAWELTGCDVANPIHHIMQEVVWRVRLRDIYTRGSRVISPDPEVAPAAPSMPQDALQEFIDSAIAPKDLRHLCTESVVAPRLQMGRMRDLSPIAFQACRVLESTTLLSGELPADVIPHTPSSVRFVEAVLLCCGYSSSGAPQ